MERQTPRFHLSPRPSHRLAFLLVGLNALALLAVALLPWTWWVRIALASWVALVGQSALRCHVQRLSKRSLLGFAWEGEQCTVFTPAGRLRAQLLPDSVSLPGFILLRFDTARGVHSAILLADSAASEDLRQLRVWLRLQASRQLPPPPIPLWRKGLAHLARLWSGRRAPAVGAAVDQRLR